MGRHDAAQPPTTDQQVEHEIAAEQPTVDAYQNTVMAHQLADTVSAGLNEMLGTPATEIAADRAAEAGGQLAAPASGYVFTAAQIEQQLRTCDDLINGLLHEDLPHARKIKDVTPPAPDTVASIPNAEAIAAMGERLIARINNQVAFIENWQSQLRAVRQNYLDQEGNTAETWRALSGGLYT